MLIGFCIDHGGAAALYTRCHGADLFSDFGNFVLRTALIREPGLRIQLPSSPLRMTSLWLLLLQTQRLCGYSFSF